MANTRKYLAAIIGLVGGAWAATTEARRFGGKKGVTPELPPAKPVPQFPTVRERIAEIAERNPGGPTAATVKAGLLDKNGEMPPADYDDPQGLKDKPVSEPGGEVQHSDVATVVAIDGSFGYLKELFKRFNGDLCPAWAASLSFFAILSFVPILICGIAVLGLLIQSPQMAASKVEQFLMHLMPGRNATDTARRIISEANIQQHAADLMKIRGWAGVLGIVSLFWAASRIFVNAATPMNAAFRTTETRNFLQMQMYAIGLLLSAGLLFLLSLVPSSGPDLMRAIPYFKGIPDPSPPWLDVIFLLLGVAVNALMFAVIYRYLPSPKADVDWREAAFGGTIVAVVWELLKQGFALYLRRFGGSDGYDKVYGALGGLIILVLWVYYSSMLLLLGAEIAKLYSDVRDAKARGDL